MGVMTLELTGTRAQPRRKWALALLALACVFVLGAATAAWFSYGPQIFMTFANSALAWCF